MINTISTEEQQGESMSGTRLRCIQEAGDLVVIPALWGHMTYNLKASIGLAKEFHINAVPGNRFRNPTRQDELSREDTGRSNHGGSKANKGAPSNAQQLKKQNKQTPGREKRAPRIVEEF